MMTRFIPATSGEVIAADGLTLHAEPTLDSQILAELDAGTPIITWIGGICREDGLWWFVESEFIAGWLPESLSTADDYLIAPIELPETDFFRPRDGDGPTDIEAKQMQFTTTNNIAMTAEVRWVLDNSDESIPQGRMYPTHRSIRFEGSLGNMMDPDFLRYLRIYPAEEWESITDISLDDLRTLLDERPDTPYLTALPDVGAARFLDADLTYLDFQNGSGIRALVQYSQSGAPVVDGELWYQFVGMTDDGEYLIHAAFALESTLLPTAAERDEIFNFDAYSEYQIVTTQAFMPTLADILTTVPDQTFTPPLSDLDNLITSLQIDTPAWCGEMPSLLTVFDTVEQSLEDAPLRVRDRPNGTVISQFMPGEEASITGGPECIDGIVWWEAFRVDEWVGWVAELEGEVYYLNEVDEP